MMKAIIFILICLFGFYQHLWADHNGNSGANSAVWILEIQQDGLPITSDPSSASNYTVRAEVLGVPTDDNDEPYTMDENGGSCLFTYYPGRCLLFNLDFQGFGDVNIKSNSKIKLKITVTNKTTNESTEVIYGPYLDLTQADLVINVGKNPQPGLIVTPPLAVCAPLTVNLTDANVTAGSFPDSWVLTYWEDEAGTKSLGNAGALTTSGTYYIKGHLDSPVVKDTMVAVAVVVNPKPEVEIKGEESDGLGSIILDGSDLCKSVVFSLTASGVPENNFSWKRDKTVNDGFKELTTGIQTGLKPDASTVYTVVGKSAEGCSDTTNFTVNVKAAPTSPHIDIATNPICAGVKVTVTGTAQPSVTGANLTFNWTGAVIRAGTSIDYTPAVTESGVKDIYMEVSEDGNDCTLKDSATITVKPLPTNVTITASDAICSNDKTVKATVAATETKTTFTWSSPTGGVASTNGKEYTYTLPSPVQTLIVFTVKATLDGCTTTDVTKDVTVNTAPTVAKPSVEENVCVNTEFEAKVPPAASGITYKWNTGQTGATIKTQLTKAGDNWVRVTATNTENCSVSDSVKVVAHSVTVKKPLKKDPSGNLEAGDPVTLTAEASAVPKGQLSYQWTPENLFVSGAQTLTAKTSGLSKSETFKVVVKDDLGCADSASIDVVVTGGTPLEITVFDVDPIFCNAGTDFNAKVTAIGGKTTGVKKYTWTIAPFVNGFTNGVGKADVKIPANGLIVGTEYSLNVSVFDGVATTVDSTVKFTVRGVPTITPMGTVANVCENTEQTFTPKITAAAGGTTIDSYGWITVKGTGTIAGAGATATATVGRDINEFELTVKDNNGCTDIDTVKIVGEGVDVTIAGNDPQIVLYGVKANLTATVVYVPAVEQKNPKYEWLPKDSISTGQGTLSVTTTERKGNEKFYAKVTNDLGCSGLDSVMINISGSALNVAPTVSKSEYCEADSVKLMPNATGGSGKYSFAWSSSTDSWTSTDSIPKYFAWAAGDYKVKVKVTDKGTGYSVTSSEVPFTINPGVQINKPTVALTGADACADAKVNFAVEVVKNGNNTLTYAWSGGATASIQNPEMTIASGLNNYIVTVTDGKGCFDTDTVKVTGHGVDVALTATPSSNIPYKGTTVVTPTVTFTPPLTAGQTGISVWSPAGLVGSTDALGKMTSKQLSADTTFKLVVTDPYGCADSNTVRVTLKTFTPLQVETLSHDTMYCQGSETINLNVKLKGGDVTNYVYAWSCDGVMIANNTTAAASVDTKALAAGKYVFKLTYGDGGAEKDTTVTVDMKALPTVAIQNKPTENCRWGELNLVASASSSEAGVTIAKYEWSALRGSIVSQNEGTARVKSSAQAAGKDQFVVKVTDSQKCVATDTAHVQVHVITLPVLNVPKAACGKTAEITMTTEGSCSGTDNVSYTWGPETVFEANTTGVSATTKDLEGDGWISFFVEVKDAKGCVDTLTSGITPVGCDFDITVTDTAVCAGSGVMLAATSTKQGVTYAWSAVNGGGSSIDGTTGMVTTVVADAGKTLTFKVTGTWVSDGVTVVREKEVSVVVRMNPSVVVNGAGICANEVVTLTAVPSSGTTPYTYTWTGAQKVSDERPDQATFTLTGTEQEIGVTVTDAKGCTITEKNPYKGDVLLVSLTSNPDLQITANTNFTLEASVTGVSSSDVTFQYKRLPAMDLGGGKGVTTKTDAPAGVSTYRVTAATASGCKDSAEYIKNVIDDEQLFIRGNSLEICQGTTDLSTYKFAARSYGGLAPYKYTWKAVDTRITLGTPKETIGGEGSEVAITSIAGVPVGTYQVKVSITDKNGRSVETNLNLKVIGQPEIKINDETTGDMLVCAATGDYTVTASGPLGTTYKWSLPTELKDRTDAVQTIATATANANGLDVTVVGTYKGCPTTVTRKLIINAAPEIELASVNGKLEACVGTDLELKAVAKGNREFTYVWTGATKKLGADSAAIITLAAGVNNTVTVEVTDANKCKAKKEQTLTAHTIDVTLTGVPAGQITKGTSVDLKTTVSNGNPAGYQYATVASNVATGIQGSTALITVTPDASTTYRVTVTSDKGCKDSADYTVNVVTENPVLTVEDIEVCLGTTEVEATAMATGGRINYSYVWSSTSSMVITPSTDADKSGASTVKLSGLAALTAGNYPVTVVVTDADAKTATKSFNLKVKSALEVKINGSAAPKDTIFCLNSTTATLTATAVNGTKYSWITPVAVAGNHEAAVTVNTSAVSAATEYKVAGDAGGCVDTVAIKVSVQALPTVSITGSTLACAGSKEVLTAKVTGNVSDYTYVWENASKLAADAVNGATTSAVVKDNNEYKVTITDAHGCTASATHQLTGEKMNISLISNPPGQVDLKTKVLLEAMVSDATAKTYKFFNATDKTDIGVATDKDTVSVYPDKATKYKVYVTSVNGCLDSATITVNVKNQPLDVDSIGAAICQLTPDAVLTAGNVLLTAEASGGIGEYTYTWTVLNNEISLDKTTTTVTDGGKSEVKVLSVGDLRAGKYPIKVTVADKDVEGNALTASTTVFLEINPLPDITISDKKTGLDTAFCQNTADVKLTANDTAETTTWRWTAPAGLGATAEIAIVTTTANPTGTLYKVIGKTVLGCVDSASINVKINPIPTISIKTDVTDGCNGGDVQLTALPIGGTKPYTYNWSKITDDTDVPLNKHDSIQTLTLELGDNLFAVSVTDANKCSALSATHNVNGIESPVIQSLEIQDSCGGTGTIVLTATNASEYEWTIDPGDAGAVNPGNDHEFIVSKPGAYMVAVEAKAGGTCVAKDTIRGTIYDIDLNVQYAFKAQDTCGAKTLPLEILSKGTTQLTGVRVHYEYKSFDATPIVTLKDTVFALNQLASAALSVKMPGTYKITSIQDTTYIGCLGILGARSSVQVGTIPQAKILPDVAKLGVKANEKYVLKVADRDAANVTYTWTTWPTAGEFNVEAADSISYTLTTAPDTVNYVLTATSKGTLQCKATDSIQVYIGVIELIAPVVVIDTNTNKSDIRIHWSEVAGADGYRIMSKKWDGYAVLGDYTERAVNTSVIDTTFTLTVAQLDTLEFFYVQAYSGSTYSESSDTVGYMRQFFSGTNAKGVNGLLAYPFDMSSKGIVTDRDFCEKFLGYDTDGNLIYGDGGMSTFFVDKQEWDMDVYWKSWEEWNGNSFNMVAGQVYMISVSKDVKEVCVLMFGKLPSKYQYDLKVADNGALLKNFILFPLSMYGQTKRQSLGNGIIPTLNAVSIFNFIEQQYDMASWYGDDFGWDPAVEDDTISINVWIPLEIVVSESQIDWKK